VSKLLTLTSKKTLPHTFYLEIYASFFFFNLIGRCELGEESTDAEDEGSHLQISVSCDCTPIEAFLFLLNISDDSNGENNSVLLFETSGLRKKSSISNDSADNEEDKRVNVNSCVIYVYVGLYIKNI